MWIRANPHVLYLAGPINVGMKTLLEKGVKQRKPFERPTVASPQRYEVHPEDLVLQGSALNVPEGIPAVLAYSKLNSKGHGMDKPLMRSFLGRHGGSLPDLRLVATGCGLIYHVFRPLLQYTGESFTFARTPALKSSSMTESPLTKPFQTISSLR